MRVAIVGSREYSPLEDVIKYVQSLPPKTLVISGDARGADKTAQQAAELRGLNVIKYPARWRRPDGSFDKGAGFRRNHDIVKNADLVVAFWDGKSKGTAHSIRLAGEYGVPVLVFRMEGGDDANAR